MRVRVSARFELVRVRVIASVASVERCPNFRTVCCRLFCFVVVVVVVFVDVSVFVLFCFLCFFFLMG